MRLDDGEVRLGAQVMVEALWYIRSKNILVVKDLDNFSSLLENAHASINLHSVQKAEHILKKFL